jgi:hypothetical protein
MVDPRGRTKAFAYSFFAPENLLSTFSDPFDPVIKFDLILLQFFNLEAIH